MTFREVLFESLHGDGITQASIDFLIGPESKDKEMPHQFNPKNPKSKSRGGLRLSQYDDWYVVTNGQQRAIIAMFAIWQRFGNKGVLKNVRVVRRHKAHKR